MCDIIPKKHWGNSVGTVTLDVKEHIAYVALNRPEKHNGVDKDLIDSLISTAKEIQKDKTVRCVILSGNGPSYCAGLDFGYVAKNPSIVPRYFLKRPWGKDNKFQRVAYIWRKLPVPVISVIHGNCFGAGMQIALASDFRFATPDAQLSIMEMKWGLIPDMSLTTVLSGLVREDVAKELTMTGRLVSGDEAQQLGLVTGVDDTPFTKAENLAKQITKQSPDAISATKYLYRKTWHAGDRLSMLWERLVQLRLLGRKNQKIALKNGLNKSADKQPFKNRSLF